MMAAYGFLGDLSTWLLVLKYLGLCLAAGSSIWGTVNDLAIKGPNGERRLTKAGAAAIGFTALGLIISLVSEDLRRRQDSASHAAQFVAEAKRTNEIIISGQQLAGLSFRWEFTSRSAALRKAMDDGTKGQYENALTSQGGVPVTPFEVVDYEALLLPLISFVADPKNGLNATLPPPADAATEQVKQSEKKQGSTVVLMSLDASSNAILSFGSIGKDAEWASNTGDKIPSAGFAGESPKRNGDSLPQVVHPGKSPSPGTEFTYAISWDLDPGTLAGVVDRRNPEIAPTAKLPKVFKIAILNGGLVLPFQKFNFAVPAVTLWGKHQDAAVAKDDFVPDDVSNMKITLVVNGSEDVRYDYYLKRVSKIDLTDDDIDVDTECTMLEFEAN
ncbi:hypothetical protein AAFG07_34845 [Bradyrhizobium sp. B097]|uniref:hypothetical protein n=1 Tax=Bradyrhizobium sp. B097 TaxID=3140244 RepID=UPI00318431FB